MLGLVLALVVSEANLADQAGALEVGLALLGRFSRLVTIFVDGAYSGEAWATWFAEVGGWALEVTKRREGARGFEVIPKRWVVERTFGWLNWYRRLSKDYEELPSSSEAFIRLAMIHIMIRRLAV